MAGSEIAAMVRESWEAETTRAPSGWAGSARRSRPDDAAGDPVVIAVAWQTVRARAGMATSGRARDVAVLRLTGATPGQVLRVIGAEAVLVTALGAVLAVVAVVPAVAGLVLALRERNPDVLVVVPWWPVAAVTGACLVIALAASLVPAGMLVRRRPTDLAGTWE